MFQKLAERWLGFPALCQLSPLAIPLLCLSSLQLQGIPMLLLGKLGAIKLDSWLDASSTVLAWRTHNHCNG